MTPVDIALLCALSAVGGALLALAWYHDWRFTVSARHFWGDPEVGRRPLPPPRRRPAAAPPPPEPAPSPALAERIHLAEIRAAEARDALATLRRLAKRPRP